MDEKRTKLVNCMNMRYLNKYTMRPLASTIDILRIIRNKLIFFITVNNNFLT